MIPDFVHHADAPAASTFLLPPGVWPCTMPEIEQTLVRPFVASRTRASIFNGLQFYLRDCQQLGIGGRVWIDGSFVTGKTDPADIDLFILASFDALNRLSLEEQTEALNLIHGSAATKTRYDVHSFGAITFPTTDVNYEENARGTIGGLQFFGRTKLLYPGNKQQIQLSKGLLQIDFGDESEVDKVARWFDAVQKEAKLWN